MLHFWLQGARFFFFLGSPWLLSCPHVFFKSSTRSVHSTHFPFTFHPLQSIHFPLQACHHRDSDPRQLRLPNALHVSDILPSPPLQGSPGDLSSEVNLIASLSCLKTSSVPHSFKTPTQHGRGALWTSLGSGSCLTLANPGAFITPAQSSVPSRSSHT